VERKEFICRKEFLGGRKEMNPGRSEKNHSLTGAGSFPLLHQKRK
jgi:hypothetical protein